MPFFSVGNLEFKMLNHLNNANEIKYDEHFFPSKSSKLPFTLTKTIFLFNILMSEVYPKIKKKLKNFVMA